MLSAMFAKWIRLLWLVLFSTTLHSFAQNAVDMKPSPQQVAWQDMEMGAIIHFGPNTFLDQEWGDGSADPKTFAPTAFDPEQWMRAIRAAGIKYVVFVAKHHDGFCLWPTEQTNYSMKSSPWEGGKGDVVRRVEEAARKYGLKFGVYLSPWDRHEPRYTNAADYDKYYLAELDELSQHYGPLAEFWLDGAGSGGHVYNFARYVEELRMSQPNTLVFADMALFEYGDIRWAGNEDGTISEENWNAIDRHGYLRWRPAEADTPLRKLHWFWHPNDEASLKTVDELMETYNKTVGHGGQLMLGLAPDRRGLLPESDAKRLEEFGAAIQKTYGHNLMAQRTPASGEAALALDGDSNTFWSAPAGSRHAVIEADFPKPVTFDHALVMEWINEGQKAEKYSIEIFKDGKWVSVASGQAIGHKKIEEFPAVTSQRVRLNILSSAGEARIREFQIFQSNGQ